MDFLDDALIGHELGELAGDDLDSGRGAIGLRSVRIEKVKTEAAARLRLEHRIGACRAIRHAPALQRLGVEIGAEQLPRRRENDPRRAVHALILFAPVQARSTSRICANRYGDRTSQRLNSSP